MTNALIKVEDHQQLALLDRANQMLAEADSIEDMKTVRDYATTVKTAMRARGMGVDAENQATRVILKAERKVGAELIRLEKAGLLAKRGQHAVNPVPTQDEKGKFTGSSDERSNSGLITMDNLGLIWRDADWWKSAARIPEDEFEQMLTFAIESGTRLAKVNFYRAEKKPKGWAEAPTKEDQGYALFLEATNLLLGWKVDQTGEGAPTKNGLLMLPFDEVKTIAQRTQHIITALNEFKAQR